jgi:hypothetical protein
MTASILAALGMPIGAVVLASLVGALLAPPELQARRAIFRSQCPSRPAPTAAPYGRAGLT